MQESFKVKFEANPKYVEEFIRINVTATRSVERPGFPGFRSVLLLMLLLPQ